MFCGGYIYANQKLETPGIPKEAKEFVKLPLEEVGKFRDKLYENPQFFDSFADENPFKFSKEDLEIAADWKRFLKDSFILLRYTDYCGLFLNSKEPARVYAVSPLKSSFEEMFCLYPLPISMDAVLLPFKGKIIYDAIFYYRPIIFGPGYKRSLNESFKEVKKKFGIITAI